jgi:hypothetical protein
MREEKKLHINVGLHLTGFQSFGRKFQSHTEGDAEPMEPHKEISGAERAIIMDTEGIRRSYVSIHAGQCTIDCASR